MRYKVGDKVRVKSLAEIESTFYSGYDQCKHTKINWNSDMMEVFCGKEFVVVGYEYNNRIVLDTRRIMSGYNWVWSEYWLEPAIPEFKLPEGLFEL